MHKGALRFIYACFFVAGNGTAHRRKKITPAIRDDNIYRPPCRRLLCLAAIKKRYPFGYLFLMAAFTRRLFHQYLFRGYVYIVAVEYFHDIHSTQEWFYIYLKLVF